MSVTKLLNDFNPETFEGELNKNIQSQVKYVSDILGEGAFGVVYTQNIGQFIIYNVKGKEIILKVAIKKIKSIGEPILIHFDKKTIDIDIKEFLNEKTEKQLKKVDYNDIYVYSSDKHPNGEFIILSLLSKLWYDGLNPHVNFMLFPLSINEKYLMDGFAIERCGLDNPINYDIKNVSFPLNSHKNVQTRLETVAELLIFCLNICDNSYNVKNNFVGNFNMVDLINELLLSYLFAYQHIYEKTNVTMIDLHSNNLMIKFIDEHSFIGNHKLSDYDSVCYELNDKYYVRMDKFILKFGDVGFSVYKKNNFVVVGDSIEYKEFKKVFVDRLMYYIEFLTNLKDMLPFNLFKKTICHDILEKEFGDFSIFSGAKLDQIKPYELVKKYFQKLKKNNYQKSFIIKSK